MDINELTIEFNNNKKELLFNNKTITSCEESKYGSILFRLDAIDINGWISLNCNAQEGWYAFLKLDDKNYKSFADNNASTFTNIVFHDFKEMQKVNKKWEFIN